MNITIHRDGQNYGPYTLDQIKERLGNGTLSESDLAWHEGMTVWLPVKAIITPLTSPPPPPQPKLQPARVIPAETINVKVVKPLLPEAKQIVVAAIIFAVIAVMLIAALASRGW